MIQLTDWHSHTTFVKATKAIDIWSFGVILYALVTGAPLFDMNRDDDPKTAEAMKALYEWDEHKRLMKLEKVNDPLTHKLLMKVLSKNPSERYQSMEELLRHDYFSSGNSDHLTHLTKPADNESGVAPPKPGLAGFTIPNRIGLRDSNAVQQLIQKLATTDFDGFYREVIISYATGQGPASDVTGAGPGIFIAAAVIEALFKSDIPCFSGLMTPAGMNWKEYFLRLDHAKARVLVVLLSKAFFQSIACFKEVHDAIKKKLVIIPVRVEESEIGAIDIARDMESMWPEAIIEKYSLMSDNRFCQIVGTFPRPQAMMGMRQKLSREERDKAIAAIAERGLKGTPDYGAPLRMICDSGASLSCLGKKD